MLSPRINATLSLPMNFSPMMKACAILWFGLFGIRKNSPMIFHRPTIFKQGQILRSGDDQNLFDARHHQQPIVDSKSSVYRKRVELLTTTNVSGCKRAGAPAKNDSFHSVFSVASLVDFNWMAIKSYFPKCYFEVEFQAFKPMPQ